jgi:hypothetical protein
MDRSREAKRSKLVNNFFKFLFEKTTTKTTTTTTTTTKNKQLNNQNIHTQNISTNNIHNLYPFVDIFSNYIICTSTADSRVYCNLPLILDKYDQLAQNLDDFDHMFDYLDRLW